MFFFFLKECRKLLVVNRPNPVHTAPLGLGKGHPVPPALQAGGGDSGNPANSVLRHLPFMYLDLSEDLKRYIGPAVRTQTHFNVYCVVMALFCAPTEEAL